MTPERTCIDAQMAAKRMVEQAKPEQLRRLIEDIRQPSREVSQHGA